MKTILALVMLLWLAGMATAQTPHSVKLNWTTSTSTCVINTNVHRSATSGGQQMGQNYVVVPDTGHGVPATITDTTVKAGETWYYTVSAYGGSCGGVNHESAMSPEFKAVIPADCLPPSTVINGVCTAPPGAPTGLTGTVQ